MQKKIIRRSYDSEVAKRFSGLPPLLQRIYAAREVQSLKELERELENLLPFQALRGINDAVQLLTEALSQPKPILIVGDFDADGATSTALAMLALKSFGATSLHFLVPNRFAFGYGLTPELVEVAKSFSPYLIVTVDNGIANHAGVRAAVQSGIKVLITDHHLPGSTLPEAHAIVNPNQAGDAFASKNLAGVGVIFYVMLALRRHLSDLNWFHPSRLPLPNMSRLLDLVALGTIADLVPLDQNNRILVYQGLKRIRAGQCSPGIVALLELAGRNFKEVSAADLGFAVGARLNAAGRLDDMSLGIECLISDDPYRAREIAARLNQLNAERKSIEQGMQSQALYTLNQLNLKGEMPTGLCLYDPTWHQGVIGILAARIKEKYHRPVIVFAKGQENELKGSARSISGFHIRDALARMDTQYPGLMLKYGGHAMAAGLTILQTKLADFMDGFNKTVIALVNQSQLEPHLMSDGELNPDELSLEVVDLIGQAGPWGQAFPEPLFDDTFEVLEQRIVGDKHLKLRLMKNGKIIDSIVFFVDLKEWPNHRCQTIRALYRLDVNEYKGRRNIQLIIEYIEAAS